MREIIVVQIGQAGNQIGGQFWQMICEEHGVSLDGYAHFDNPLQEQRINVYFEEINSKYVPRAVLVDTDPAGVESLLRSEMSKLFDPNKAVHSNESTGNNWAKGKNNYKLITKAADLIRRVAENCDCLQGFEISHSLGGGTGSGVGAALIMKIKELFPDKIASTFTIFPSPKISDVVVDPYNSVLALSPLVETCDLNCCLDNEALYRLCVDELRIRSPTYRDLNQLVASAMSGVTTGFRFPGQLNTDLRKVQTNMVVFPRLHLLGPSVSPLHGRTLRGSNVATVPELVRQVMRVSSQMITIPEGGGRLLTAALLARGRISVKELEEAVYQSQQRMPQDFVEWIPHNVKTAICDIPPRGLKMSATFLSNTTGVRHLLDRISHQVKVMLKKKAFTHWFTQAGIEPSTIAESAHNVDELSNEYFQCQELRSKSQASGGETKNSVASEDNEE